ncbi:MAG: DNA repair protein RadC [Ignavibacteriaceae bacterium]|nr:DNA repair protein RadC [Ignavibacteriaceae bacterium]
MSENEEPLKFRDFPADDKPREKLLKYGADKLSESELLAILIRTGTKNKSVLDLARGLILEHKNLTILSQVRSAQKLREHKGIGADKAATLLAAFEIARRVKPDDRYEDPNVRVTSPEYIVNKFSSELKTEMVEKFYVIALNAANSIISTKLISSGHLDASVVHPREIFKFAIECSAKSIILLHNHPSGNTEPSKADISITDRIVKGGHIFSIKVLDHIIIAGNGFSSFVERGLIADTQEYLSNG